MIFQSELARALKGSVKSQLVRRAKDSVELREQCRGVQAVKLAESRRIRERYPPCGKVMAKSHKRQR